MATLNQIKSNQIKSNLKQKDQSGH